MKEKHKEDMEAGVLMASKETSAGDLTEAEGSSSKAMKGGVRKVVRFLKYLIPYTMKSSVFRRQG